MQVNYFTYVSLMSLMLLFIAQAQAEQFKQVGDYAIHYNAFNSKMIPPEVAKAYKVQRSGNNAVLTVAVRKKAEDGDVAVPAKVTVKAANLVGHEKKIVMDRIDEPSTEEVGSAIYYVGQFNIDNGEHIRFELSVDPEEKGKVTKIKLEQKFFTE